MLKFKLSFILSLICFNTFASKESVSLYTYHLKPPFIVDLEKMKGLSFDLAKVLSKNSEKFNFVVNYLPRKRLDAIKEKKIVLWSNPPWVSDSEQKEYFWSRGIVKDSDVIISHRDHPLIFNDIKKVTNKNIIGVRGYVYPELSESFKEKKLERTNVNTENQIISMIEKGRRDGGVVSLSTLKFNYSINPKLKYSIVYNENLKAKFYRKIYFTKDLQLIFSEVSKLLESNTVQKELNKLFGVYEMSYEKESSPSVSL